MTETRTAEASSELSAFNYCVSFIDLLGQREALRGQNLLPTFESDDQRQRFYSVAKESIGSILGLQKQAERMLAKVAEPRLDSPLRAQLSPQDQEVWDQMRLTRIKSQRWSDGIVSFVSLGDQQIKCPMIGVFSILGLAGTLCLLGLALHHPIRGAIDVAWGVELHPGELYGPAVARAYELESEVAQYPRIVVGQRVVDLLTLQASRPEQDPFSRCDRDVAETCLRMLLQDTDGFTILHYLGEQFSRSISKRKHVELFSLANEFVLEQLEQHRRSGNSKLAFRYTHLAHYFDAHPLSSAPEAEAQPVDAPDHLPAGSRPPTNGR